MAEQIPTALVGARFLSGDTSQAVPALCWFVGRAAEIAGGIYLSGNWKGGKSVKAALYGSAAVQAFLFAWVAMNKEQDVPSGDSARELLDGQKGAVLKVAGHWLARSTMISAGLYAAGERKQVFKQGLFAGGVIEASILAYLAARKDPTAPQPLLGAQ